jgi:hypothetical protein
MKQNHNSGKIIMNDKLYHDCKNYLVFVRKLFVLEKSQISIIKIQINSKFQFPKYQTV